MIVSVCPNMLSNLLPQVGMLTQNGMRKSTFDFGSSHPGVMERSSKGPFFCFFLSLMLSPLKPLDQIEPSLLRDLLDKAHVF